MSAKKRSVVLKGMKKRDPEEDLPPSIPSSPERSAADGAGPGPSFVSGMVNGGQQQQAEAKPARQIDRYGFLYSMSEADEHYDPVLKKKKMREREAKWIKMLKNWDDWMDHKPHKVKERCRKGIPDSVRGKAWVHISGAHKLLNDNRGLFDELVGKPDPDVVPLVIDKDLDRTFPSHELFAKDGELGQRELRRVLKAYAVYNEKTGYCQAMAPVAATLLMHMTTEEAFWVLVQICEYYLPGYYSPGLHAFQIDALILKDLMKKFIPDTKAFMDSKSPNPKSPNPRDRNLDPMLYCTEWFMSMFSRSLPWPTVLRVWDIFFLEGLKVLFKTSLALLRMAFAPPDVRKECKGFFELTKRLRELPITITHEDVLIPELLKYRIQNRDLYKEHIKSADLHFTEERVRQMELQARQAKRVASTASINSDMSDLV